VEDCQEMGIGVSSQTNCKRRLRARRVEIEAHGDHPFLLEVLAKVAWLEPQPLGEKLE